MMEVKAISLSGLTLGAFLILVVLVLMHLEKIPLKKDLVIGALRTVGQLALVGYLLEFIFQVNQWAWVLGLLVLMIVVAAHTAKQRLSAIPVQGLFSDIGLALFIGAGLTIVWVTQVVIQVTPWYHPQYMLPLAGMVIGNSMNSAALTLDRFFGELSARKAEIETLLALGASPKAAAKEPYQAAIKAAMIPNINAMMIVGIVSFPGMMTGQILAGQSPLSAVNYQIIVMFMLTCAGTLTSVLLARLALKKSFNQAGQLI